MPLVPYNTVAYSTPPIPPQGTGIPYGPLPDTYFNVPSQNTPHMQHVTSHSHDTPQQQSFRPQPHANASSNRPMAETLFGPESIKEQMTNILREHFGVALKGKSRVYQKPYPDYYDTIPYPRGFKVPDFVKFNGEDGRTTMEHIGQFLAQCGEAGSSDALRLRLFPLSLSGNAFTWFTSLAPNSIHTWAQLEQKFHEYFYTRDIVLRLIHLTSVSKKYNESISEYIRRFRGTKS
jgi:hypothetical protein